MSATNWLQRASGLFVPYRDWWSSGSPWRFLPCSDCCENCYCQGCGNEGIAACQWKVEISGITNDTCTECAEEFNKEHIVSQNYPRSPWNCRWSKQPGFELGCYGTPLMYGHIFAGVGGGPGATKTIIVYLQIDDTPGGDWVDGTSPIWALYSVNVGVAPDCLAFFEEEPLFLQWKTVGRDDTLCDGFDSASIKVTAIT